MKNTALPNTGNGYRRLFTAGIINGIGDRFSSIAMLALVLELTGSGMAVGISLGMRVLPYLFLAPLSGRLGSRLPRKAIMIATDLFRVPVALAFLWVDGESRLWVLYAASFILASGEAIYSPLRKSAIPLLVPRDRLFAVNGLEQLMTGCVLILGAFAGGALSLWFGPGMAFFLNAVSFLVAAFLVSGISFPVPLDPDGDMEGSAFGADPKPNIKGHRQGNPWRSLGLLVSGSLALQVIIGYELLVPLLNGLDNVLISVYAVQEFHAGELGVGAFYAALGMGLSLSFFAGRYLNRGLLAVALTALLIEGGMLMWISGSDSFALAFVLYILLALAGGTGNACLDTLVMRATPSSEQSFLFGILSAAGNTLLGLSMLASGWLLESVSPRVLGFAGGAGFACIALLLGGYALLRARKKGFKSL
ncbi:MFS transporter [Paenibacillus albidus]|uniref:MFS transporter n=1 Tax=Paenibacillus albidus TaxID=2041023 RepID=A0A917D3B8_9BACL|nr:MFS transporter [Paenibacillus albidus]GGG10134.1 MFS transporter [Paenibacillus albidus]